MHLRDSMSGGRAAVQNVRKLSVVSYQPSAVSTQRSEVYASHGSFLPEVVPGLKSIDPLFC